MNNISELAKELYELVEKSKRGIDVDDAMIECIMQKIKEGHDRSIDCDVFLDDAQKLRRKSLYADAVRKMKKYCEQAIADNKEVQRKIAEHKL